MQQYFDSQLRREADDSHTFFNLSGIDYFNSQPRKGADSLPASDRHLAHISTHSPARGLTISNPAGGTRTIHFNSQPRKGADNDTYRRHHHRAISTHSPARGLTLALLLRLLLGCDFNSQPRKGADLISCRSCES